MPQSRGVVPGAEQYSAPGVSFDQPLPPELVLRIGEASRRAAAAMHIAIMREPFLSLLLSGRKTIESRFGVRKSAPWHRINRGDLVMVASGGPLLRGCFTAGDVVYLDLLTSHVDGIENRYGDALATWAEADFWERRANARWASLVEVVDLLTFEPVKVRKRDMRGWVVFDAEPTIF